MSESSGAAGWHHDPTGRFEFRYHNGVQWTADVSVGGRRFVDPAGPPTGSPGWGTQPGHGRPPGKAMALTAFIVGLVSLIIAWVPFLFVAGAVGAVVAFVFGVLGVRQATRHGGLGRTYAVTGIVLAVAAAGLCVVGFLLTRVVMREVNAYLEPGRYDIELTTCHTEGITGSTDPSVTPARRLVTVQGNISNTDSTIRGYTIIIDYLVDGVRADSDTVTIDRVDPGATAPFEANAFVRTGVAVGCQVAEVRGPPPFGRPVD